VQLTLGTFTSSCARARGYPLVVTSEINLCLRNTSKSLHGTAPSINAK